MIFAKIDFINLLPLHVFIKKNLSSQTKQIIEYHKSYPSSINKKFKKRKVDAAVISSIASRRCKKCLDFGIVANGVVDSVLVIPGSYKKDFQSDTSNALAKVLKIEGEVVIGDKALYRFHNSDEDFIDLATKWKEKYNLPFVFARLCVNKHEKYLEQISKNFLKTKVYIPQYILEKYAKRSGISKKQIQKYLTKINYNLGKKEKKSLKLFLRLSKDI
ncbi:MAG: hypothetical protein K8R39_01700 [Arcobacteraceae bacterium]|nr:hypothetical protein [Arcobacteraceae bacterium]